ncbi:hypothetical protein P171DRAFT_431398 [Karstenula rhodostoma CBS 690.94]|uniref:NAD dependent epimerase/dehydratase n=1 Tax=Karstenula rhodostoma CBS 690.94 TaxID=1392251 RepID=A0A9P4UEB2_9PLEO|nr:hypothetical protein P171DRAFT_431398 [Karstenula rhodostoma CBS 690.94]
MSLQPRLIDAVPQANRQKPMGVLALGLSRTGTMSLKVALEKLGYDVYHCSECVMRWRENHIHLFKEAMEAKLHGKGQLWTGAELDKVLQNYTAIEDIPCLHFVDELLDQYPTAKVILTTRDIDSWEKSVRAVIFKIVNLRVVRFMAVIDPVFWQPYHWLLKATVDKWTNGDLSDSVALRKAFTDHYDHIRARVPTQNLLEFHPRDGWAPLCEFLGHETPRDIPFPNVNDAAYTINIHYFLVVLRLWHISKKYLGIALVAAIAYGLSWCMRAG